VHLARRAIEQPKAKLILKLPNQDTQAGGGDEERLGGAAEASVLRNQVEAPELPRCKIH
jgi:hypothetical protein